MRFSEIKDANGTSLQAYAETLQAKAKDAGLVTVIVFAAKDGPNKGIHAISNINGSVGHALIALGTQMSEEPDNTNVIAPVSVPSVH